MAKAALQDRDLDARAASLALHRWARGNSLENIPQPRTDKRTLVVAAAFVEMLAERFGQQPPVWALAVGGLDQPFYFYSDARTNPEFGEALKRETPEPLIRRNLVSTSNYLQHI